MATPWWKQRNSGDAARLEDVLDGLTIQEHRETLSGPMGTMRYTVTAQDGVLVYDGLASSKHNLAFHVRESLRAMGRVEPAPPAPDMSGFTGFGDIDERGGNPANSSAVGLTIAAIERGVDVEARLAAYNEEELTEEDDW